MKYLFITFALLTSGLQLNGQNTTSRFAESPKSCYMWCLNESTNAWEKVPCNSNKNSTREKVPRNSSKNSTREKILKSSLNGHSIKDYQKYLISLGYEIEINGKADKATMKAHRQHQKQQKKNRRSNQSYE